MSACRGSVDCGEAAVDALLAEMILELSASDEDSRDSVDGSSSSGDDGFQTAEEWDVAAEPECDAVTAFGPNAGVDVMGAAGCAKGLAESASLRPQRLAQWQQEHTGFVFAGDGLVAGEELHSRNGRCPAHGPQQPHKLVKPGAATSASNFTIMSLLEFSDLRALVLSQVSVLGLWRMRRACRRCKTWASEALQQLPPLQMLTEVSTSASASAAWELQWWSLHWHTMQWRVESLQPGPLRRLESGFATLANGKYLVIAGGLIQGEDGTSIQTSGLPTSDCLLYDREQHRWLSCPSLPSAISGAGCFSLCSHCARSAAATHLATSTRGFQSTGKLGQEMLIVAGGETADEYTSDMLALSIPQKFPMGLSNQYWQPLADVPGSVFFGGAVHSDSKTVYGAMWSHARSCIRVAAYELYTCDGSVAQGGWTGRPSPANLSSPIYACASPRGAHDPGGLLMMSGAPVSRQVAGQYGCWLYEGTGGNQCRRVVGPTVDVEFVDENTNVIIPNCKEGTRNVCAVPGGVATAVFGASKHFRTAPNVQISEVICSRELRWKRVPRSAAVYTDSQGCEKATSRPPVDSLFIHCDVAFSPEGVNTGTTPHLGQWKPSQFSGSGDFNDE